MEVPECLGDNRVLSDRWDLGLKKSGICRSAEVLVTRRILEGSLWTRARWFLEGSCVRCSVGIVRVFILRHIFFNFDCIGTFSYIFHQIPWLTHFCRSARRGFFTMFFLTRINQKNGPKSPHVVHTVAIFGSPLMILYENSVRPLGITMWCQRTVVKEMFGTSLLGATDEHLRLRLLPDDSTYKDYITITHGIHVRHMDSYIWLKSMVKYTIHGILWVRHTVPMLLLLLFVEDMSM